jgi:hypothetical protein
MTMKFIKQLLYNIRKTIMTDSAEIIEKIDEQIKSLSDSYIKLVGKDDGSKYDESELGKNSKTLTEKQTELTNKKTQLEDDKNKKEDSQDHRSRVSAQVKRLQNFLTSPRPQQDVTFRLKNLSALGGKDLVVDDGAHWNFSRIFLAILTNHDEPTPEQIRSVFECGSAINLPLPINVNDNASEPLDEVDVNILKIGGQLGISGVGALRDSIGSPGPTKRSPQ